MRISLAWYNVAGLEAAKRFYGEVLGLEPGFEMPGWAEFGSPGMSIGLAEGPAGGGATVVLEVADLDSEMARLRAAGVEFCGPVEEIPGVVRLAAFTDPSGNRLQLAQSLLSGDVDRVR